jgi:hypothetical protein
LHNSIFQQLRIIISPFAFFYSLVDLVNLKQKILRDVVFIASPVDVQTPMGKRYFPDKLEGVINVVKKHNLSVLYVFHLFSIKRKFETKSDFIRLEILIPLIIFTNPISFMRNYRITKDELQNQRLTTMKQRIRETLWISLFSLVKPKIVFGIGMDQVILSVCQRMGIVTVEAMHGLFDSERIPFSFKIEPETVKPEVFLSWHEEFTSIVQKLGIPAVTIGYPNTCFEKSYLGTEDLENPKILVTLSWGEKNCIDPNGTMTPELYEYLKNVPSNILKFRLHPVSCNSKKQISQNSKWLKNEFLGCSLVSPFDESLWESLSKCSFHVSYESSSFFEASLLGKNTLLLKHKEKFTLPIPEKINDLELLHFDKNTFSKKNSHRNKITYSSKFTAPFQEKEIEKILVKSNLLN